MRMPGPQYRISPELASDLCHAGPHDMLPVVQRAATIAGQIARSKDRDNPIHMAMSLAPSSWQLRWWRQPHFRRGSIRADYMAGFLIGNTAMCVCRGSGISPIRAINSLVGNMLRMYCVIDWLFIQAEAAQGGGAA